MEIGGSLAGLMCGVALKHNGHSVTIFERAENERQSHMSGVCLGLDAEEYLASHDRVTETFTHRSNRLQTLDNRDRLRIFVNILRDITSWDTLYFRLRASFDAYASSVYPSPPPTPEGGGRAVYSCCKEVIQLASTANGEGMTLAVMDRKTQEVTDVRADLVIGADGPDSRVRSQYLSDVQRKYVGYIAWRGTVSEKDVSEATRQIFHRSVTLQLMHLQHCLVYTIPGPNGSLAPGERLLNFLWYTNESFESLHEIMVDGIDGHRHHNIVPAGRVRQDIWAARLDCARRVPLATPFLEIIESIKSPFIQVITEFCSPQAAFEDGKVLLVGDALSLFRPHTALSGTQAAFDALRVADYAGGRLSLRDWEERVLRFAHLHWSQSMWWGSYYQNRRPFAVLLGLHYWAYCAVDLVKSWWYHEAPLLRTSVSKFVPDDS